MDAFVSLPLVGKDSSPVSGTVLKNSHYFDGVRSVSANEALLFPTANSAVEYIKHVGLEEKIVTYFSTSSVAAVTAAINSAVPGVVSSGQTTLVAGTKAVTISGLTTTNKAIVSLVAQGGTSTGVYEYAGVCTANTLTITAVDVTGTKVATDTAVVNYFIL